MARYISLLLFIGLAFWSCEEDEPEDCAGVAGGDNICGCTDSTATNYASTATFDDESCEYDTTPPTVIITSPIDGTIVSDSVEITCMSTDDKGVEMVELWVNGVSTGVADSTEPYSLKWITSDIEHGNYTIVVRAYDLNGNITDSNPIILTVSNQSDYRLFTATFNGEFDSDATTIIFISDSDGNILADTSFIGDASFDLIADRTSDVPPDKINITTIGKVNGNTQITTNLGINKGSNWTWYNPYYQPDVIGESYYTFTNIPEDFYRVVLSSKGLTNRTSINESDTYSLSHYNNNEDVLIMGLMNDGTALYKIIENVSVTETHALDFSEFLQAEQRIINNLTGIDCNWLGHSGFSIEDSHLGYNGYRLSNGSGEGIAWTAGQNFITNYPVSFTKFTTGFTVGQWNVPGEKSWYQKTFGDMPESVRLMDGDINVISSDIDNFVMEISGSEPDQWSVELVNSQTGIEWNIYVKLNITSGMIPYFPLSVNEVYPEINRDLFVINNVSLQNFLCADNAEEWQELYFNTDGYYGDFCSGRRDMTYYLE